MERRTTSPSSTASDERGERGPPTATVSGGERSSKIGLSGRQAWCCVPVDMHGTSRLKHTRTSDVEASAPLLFPAWEITLSTIPDAHPSFSGPIQEAWPFTSTRGWASYPVIGSMH